MDGEVIRQASREQTGEELVVLLDSDLKLEED